MAGDVSDLLWRLPGPAAFVDEIVDDVRQGVSVVLCLPEYAAPGLREAVGEKVRAREICKQATVDQAAMEAGIPPPQVLRQAIHGPSAEKGDGARELATDRSLRDWLIWVEGVGQSQWPAWKRFLEEFEAASRAASDCNGLRVVVVARGSLANSPPRAEVRLAVRKWQGVVEPLDMLLLVYWLMRDADASPLRRRLQISLIAELAGTDPLLAETLCRCDLPALINPLDALRGFAQRRSWGAPLPTDRSELWAGGMADMIHGRQFRHSAALAVSQGHDHDELDRRIWRAQIQVLFPFVEEQRASLVKDLTTADCLRLPWVTPFGRIEDPLDLEINHLCRMVSHVKRVPPAKRELIRVLVEVRNSLAHLEKVPEELLLRLAPADV